ncbi:1,4-alpha-glucan branching enzyme GlgB [compost metagenome]
MPGDEWQKFANLRALYAYMWTHPGAKLLFMGDEFAQTSEWDFFKSLNWDLLQHAPHKGMLAVVKALNELYKTEAALYHYNFSHEGFEWQEADDADQSIYVYQRRSDKAKDTLVIAINLTPVYRENYRIGIPVKGKWQEIFNSDGERFYGSNKLNLEARPTENIAHQHQQQSIVVNLPPLAVSIFKKAGK